MAITLRSHQLMKMGTWLPETCWATCTGVIKDNTKWHIVGFLSHTELRCTVNHTSDSTSFSFSVTLKMKAVLSFESLGTIHPTKHRNIPEYLINTQTTSHFVVIQSTFGCDKWVDEQRLVKKSGSAVRPFDPWNLDLFQVNYCSL